MPSDLVKSSRKEIKSFSPEVIFFSLPLIISVSPFVKSGAKLWGRRFQKIFVLLLDIESAWVYTERLTISDLMSWTVTIAMIADV